MILVLLPVFNRQIDINLNIYVNIIGLEKIDYTHRNLFAQYAVRYQLC